MRCRDVQRLCSDYVDGELDDRRASAVRGHIRTCADCLALVRDEAAIADAAEELEAVDPPAHLWARIESDLAQREIGDAKRSGLWLAWPRLRQAALPLAVAGAAALAVFSYTQRGDQTAPAASTPTPAPTPVAVAPIPAVAPAPPPPPPRFRDVRTAQIQDAERQYLKTISELETLVSDLRGTWKPAQRAKFRKAEHSYRTKLRAARNLLAVGGDATAVSAAAHDPVFNVYQGRIRYLQRVSFGEAL